MSRAEPLIFQGPAFDVERAAFTYPGGLRAVIDDVSLTVRSGSIFAIVGPNGSGKSTLLRLLLGALHPAGGHVRYEGRDVSAWPRRELARRIGAVAQVEEMPFPLTVRELVAMGRYPHLGPWRRAAHADDLAIEVAMERCAVSDLASRPMDRLSGGERQRARIARALAQQPATLVLDEPTALLDIAHEMAIFELLAGLSRRDGTTIVLVTHHLNLAARYATELLLLERGRVVAGGPAAAVFTRDIIERVYGWPVRVYAHPGPGRDAGSPQIAPLTQHESEAPQGPGARRG
jgi:iron complex transport system ATP-binding protein